MKSSTPPAPRLPRTRPNILVARRRALTTIAFNGAPDDTYSSPFYDYASDTIYVGDDNGSLHKFTPVFGGTPAEVTTSGWPVAANSASNGLTSPVYDQASTQVFVADGGGFLYRVNAVGTPAPIASGQLGFAPSDFTDAPIVDSTAGQVYVFAASAGSRGSAGCGGGVHVCSAAFELTTSFAAGTFGNEAEMGTGTTSVGTNAVYDGDFDNAYYTSANSTGNLYACGHSSGIPTLYEITIASGSMQMGAATPGPLLSGSSTRCSPLTEFYNAGTDFLFLSVETNGKVADDCTGATGCIMTFTLTGAPISGSTTATAGLTVEDGTSGITIDNAGTEEGSQVYFTPLMNQGCVTGGSGGCAIQASQSALD